jgi:ParB family chromosome partitioning protein
MAGNGKHKQPVDAPRTNVFWCDPHQLVIVGLDTSDTEEHPLWDARGFQELEESFVVNILRNGVVSTITARSVDGQLQVVEGRRRVLHAREALRRQIADGIPEAELLRIPVRTIRGDDAHLLAMSRVANSFRREETILEKGFHAQRLLAMGRSEADVAITYGVDETTVKAWLSLLESDTNLRKAIIEGKVSPSAAYRLARLPHPDQRKALEELLASGHASIREARRVTAKRRGHGDTVGARRRTLRDMRDLLRTDKEPDDFQRGVVAALDLVLGAESEGLDTRIRRWTIEAAAHRKQLKDKPS